jgi:hypothetical protein
MRDEFLGMIYSLNVIKKDLLKARQRYVDHRGNLDEAEMFVDDALSNIEGHLKDMEEGKE